MMRALVFFSLIVGASAADTTAAPATTMAATTAAAAATTAAATTAAGAAAVTTPQTVTATVELSFTKPLSTDEKKKMAESMAADASKATVPDTFVKPAACTSGNTKAECAIVTTTTAYECKTKAALSSKETSADCTKEVYTTTKYMGARRRRLTRKAQGETFYAFTMATAVPTAVVDANKAAMQSLGAGNNAAAKAMQDSIVAAAKKAATDAGVTVGSLAPTATVKSTGGAPVGGAVIPVVGGASRAFGVAALGLIAFTMA